MDKQKLTKFIMLGLGTGLSLAASLINSKNQDDKMKEEVANQVAKALNQTKES